MKTLERSPAERENMCTLHINSYCVFIICLILFGVSPFLSLFLSLLFSLLFSFLVFLSFSLSFSPILSPFLPCHRPECRNRNSSVEGRMSVTKTVTKEGKREDRKRQSGSIQKLGLRWVDEFSVSRTQIRQSE